ncbi:MAG: hypothetical protein U0V04_08905 [Spirosomataceae bacterium]
MKSTMEAVAFACKAASISVTRMGAQGFDAIQERAFLADIIQLLAKEYLIK